MDNTVETEKPAEELGPVVTIAEAAKSARSACQRCYGQGIVARIYIIPTQGVARECRIPSVCACAQKRFLKAHPNDVTWGKDGALHWKTAQEVA